ncbi:hypothetical protein [Pedococcus sp. 5OH_020]|uniref:hypothetical protein n=1 Tax=Pedococcus sp. 5OH_020 TaxID=2989814 RepID=UPI0022E9F430|nr:hypothetical protein [Pedococcus sp. 5OH_020]
MTENTSSEAEYVDQDSEPTMTAPEEGRPDGLDALKQDSSSDEQGTGDDGSDASAAAGSPT